MVKVSVRIDQQQPNLTLTLTKILKLNTRIQHDGYKLTSHRGLFYKLPYYLGSQTCFFFVKTGTACCKMFDAKTNISIHI